MHEQLAVRRRRSLLLLHELWEHLQVLEHWDWIDLLQQQRLWVHGRNRSADDLREPPRPSPPGDEIAAPAHQPRPLRPVPRQLLRPPARFLRNEKKLDIRVFGNE